ncbi:mycofactocin system transcriptional regulator [Georgenia sp. 10Sc9-8]|uniref:Mycofactocin system transcriptional regulator n=1 Tax=Georgenia halotolerans TaxID=3028317 RepID=A0ABT5TUD3_9MICO|nr:mycofactocin system transcriptional regulator [Georgenia halotolerans]
MGTAAPGNALAPSPGAPATARPGRPPLTTHATLERLGIELFTTRGFEATSVDDIAAAAGISRRTFFRYFSSKADVVWGKFDTEVAELRADLAATPEDAPLMDALRTAVVRFNTVPAAHQAQHRRRLRLLLEVPDLIAHSTLRYAQWRRAVDEFAAARLGQDPEDLLPRTIGRCALGATLAAYEQWMREEDADLGSLIDQAFRALSVGFEQTVASTP